MGWRICPACEEKSYFRRSDKGRVCGRCRDLINEALEMHKQAEARAAKKEEVAVMLPEMKHWWPGFYNDKPRWVDHDTCREGLRDAIIRVYRTFAVPAIRNVSRAVRPWNAEFDGTFSSPCGILTLRQYRALKALRLHIERVIAETYHGGVEDGRDLLYQLAQGEISPDELQKKDVERGKRFQERRKKLNKDLAHLDPEEY